MDSQVLHGSGEIPVLIPVLKQLFYIPMEPFYFEWTQVTFPSSHSSLGTQGTQPA